MPSRGAALLLAMATLAATLPAAVHAFTTLLHPTSTTLTVVSYQAFSEADSATIHGACSNLETLSTARGAPRRRYLVTGAAGFIGFHTARALRARGDVVVGIDNFNDYYPVSLKRARAAELLAWGVFVVSADINDEATLGAVFGACTAGFTHVAHFAAQAGVRYAARNPQSYVSSNVAGTVSLLEVIKAQPNIPVVVYASSSSVYGITRTFPFTEADRGDVPASLYAATKRSQELLMHTYYHLYGISTTGLRFFTVYGPWGRPDMAMMSFSRRILEKRNITVFQGPGGSELARDFTFIGDIVQGVLGAMDSTPLSVKGKASYRIFNLGNTQPVTMSTFVRVLEGAIGRHAKIKYTPVPGTGDVLRTHANISAATAAFGYNPRTQLVDGIRQFMQWYLQYYGPDGRTRAPDDYHYKPD